MADKNREVIRVVVEVTRLGQTLQHDGLEFERRARQYLAVSDPELAVIFERERGRLAKTLLRLQEYIAADNSDIKGLLDTVARLELIPPAMNSGEATGAPPHRRQLTSNSPSSATKPGRLKHGYKLTLTSC